MPRAPSRLDAGTEFSVGGWHVDPQLNEVVRGERRRHLEPRVMDLLVYLASRPGEVVTKEDLTRDVWRGAFVGDDALASAVSALRRALDDDPRHPRVLKTIPKRGYRLIAAVTGGEVSVAVLPLDNLSGDPDQEFFADGMTEALISALGSNPRGLRVTSRTSSMRFKQSGLALPEIAQRLGVRMVIEGSVLQQGELVRITLQLIDALSDAHLWAEVYERALGDILALQSEIAFLVEREIRTELGVEEVAEVSSAPQVHPASFVEYLKGRYEFYRFTPHLFARALRHFERARDIDPDSPYPWVGIADVWGNRGNWGLIPAVEAGPEVAKAAAKAVELGKNVPEAQIVLAKVFFYWEWDWSRTEATLERALELNPSNATALWSHCLFLTAMNRLDEALPFARRAVDCDPLNPLPVTLLGLDLSLLGEVREGMGALRHASTLGSLPQPRLILWMLLAREQREEEAVTEAAGYFSTLGRLDIAQLLTEQVAKVGYTVAMAKAAEALAARRNTGYVQPTQIARLFIHAGEKRRALEWLECACRERDPFLVHLGWPEWESLRSEPAFEDLVSRVGLPT